MYVTLGTFTWIIFGEMGQNVILLDRQPRGGGGGRDLVLTLSGCVFPKIQGMGLFSASSEMLSLKTGVKCSTSLNMVEECYYICRYATSDQSYFM